MNQGQEQFFNFILERIQDNKKDEAKTLLNESFAKQSEDLFSIEYMNHFSSKILEILKPEYADEVKTLMQGFSKSTF